MRGRLIFPFLAELRRLDTAAMASTDPDGAGPLTGGFDPDFKEPVLVDRDGDGVAERERAELPAIRVPCQVEPKVFEDLRMLASGDSPRSDISLVFPSLWSYPRSEGLRSNLEHFGSYLGARCR